MWNIRNHIRRQYDKGNELAVIWMSTIIDITMVIIIEATASPAIVRATSMSTAARWAHCRAVKATNRRNNGIGWKTCLPNQVATKRPYVYILHFPFKHVMSTMNKCLSIVNFLAIKLFIYFVSKKWEFWAFFGHATIIFPRVWPDSWPNCKHCSVPWPYKFAKWHKWNDNIFCLFVCWCNFYSNKSFYANDDVPSIRSFVFYYSQSYITGTIYKCKY